MRTSVDIPDELYRQAKIHAALNGLRLRDVIEKGIRMAIADKDTSSKPKRRVKFPIIESSEPGRLSIDELLKAESQMYEEEDRERGLSM